MLWWSTHRFAVREVRGSNPALGILFHKEEFNLRIYLTPAAEWTSRSCARSQNDQMDGCSCLARAQPSYQINYAGEIDDVIEIEPALAE